MSENAKNEITSMSNYIQSRPLSPERNVMEFTSFTPYQYEGISELRKLNSPRSSNP